MSKMDISFPGVEAILLGFRKRDNQQVLCVVIIRGVKQKNKYHP
jgi:hypothetical protein